MIIKILKNHRKAKLQEWAGLDINPTAEVLVFVGRWSAQKGVDIIADLAPALLNDNPAVQIIAVGPIVDLLGRFSALKVERLRQLYPGRVFAKTEFIAIPPFMNTFVFCLYLLLSFANRFLEVLISSSSRLAMSLSVSVPLLIKAK